MRSRHRALWLAAALLAIAGGAHAEARGGGATMADLFALRDVGGPLRPSLSPSPDGRRVAVFVRETELEADRYRYRLISIDLRSGATVAVADTGGVILRSAGGRRSGGGAERQAFWSPDGRWLYFLAEREGRSEIWRASSDGGRAAPVFAGEGDVRRMAAIDGGTRLAFETMTPRAELAAQQARQERNGFQIDDDFAPGFSLDPLPDEDAGARAWRLDLERGVAVPGAAADFEPDAHTAGAWIAPLDPNTRVRRPALGVYAGEGDDAITCSDPRCSGALEGAWVLSGSAVVFQRLEGHSGEDTALYLWDRSNGSVRLIRRERALLESCFTVTPHLVCLRQSSLQPRQLVRIALDDGTMRVLYDPNPQWRSVRRPRLERLYHTDAEGNQSYADLVYPLDNRRGRTYPLVIVQYRSRGFLRAGVGDETPILPLSARGYFVLSVDRPEFLSRAARLSIVELQREIELDGSEHAAKREALLAFVDEITARGLVDPARMAITGLSDGAETVYHMLPQSPRFAAAVASSPPIDPVQWSLESRHFRASRTADYGITAPWDHSAPEWTQWWRDNTAAAHADDIRTPLLLNLSESEAMRAFPFVARVEEHIPVEIYLYPGAYHLKWRPAQLWAAQERTIAWIEFWLRGRLVETQSDPDRGPRWRALARDYAPAGAD